MSDTHEAPRGCQTPFVVHASRRDTIAVREHEAHFVVVLGQSQVSHRRRGLRRPVLEHRITAVSADGVGSTVRVRRLKREHAGGNVIAVIVAVRTEGAHLPICGTSLFAVRPTTAANNR